MVKKEIMKVLKAGGEIEEKGRFQRTFILRNENGDFVDYLQQRNFDALYGYIHQYCAMSGRDGFIHTRFHKWGN